MASLLKMVETSKALSLIFDFQINDSKKKYISIILIIIRVFFLVTFGVLVILLQSFLYFLYLQMFFTSLPGALVKKTRMESLGYDDSNKWLFNISYLMLYSFVLIFEFLYIFINYLIVILSFVLDCMIWILTLGKTKLVNTKLSLNENNYSSQDVRNIDILAIISTFVSILLFYLLGELNLLNRDLDFVSWLSMSVPIIGLNVLFYMFFYNPQIKSDSKIKTEDQADSVK